MTLVVVVRHGLTASTGKALTGWLPGIPLDDRGRDQAAALGVRLAGVHLDAIITSPLERCQQTAALIAAARSDGAAARPDEAAALHVDERLGECHYGEWTGQPLKRLAADPLWKVVQAHPSAVRFPGKDGESMLEMQQRAVGAIRDWNAELGREACYVVCSHGDVIKAILADSLGMHLDMSQRIQVDPCSVSVIRYTPLRPFVLRMNDTGADVTGVLKRAGKNESAGPGKESESDAQVGGGPGAETA